jgi:hypothetical protein
MSYRVVCVSRTISAGRAQYLEHFFAIKEELPTLYDLVINTDLLGIDQAVGAIVAAAQA